MHVHVDYSRIGCACESRRGAFAPAPRARNLFQLQTRTPTRQTPPPHPPRPAVTDTAPTSRLLAHAAVRYAHARPVKATGPFPPASPGPTTALPHGSNFQEREKQQQGPCCAAPPDRQEEELPRRPHLRPRQPPPPTAPSSPRRARRIVAASPGSQSASALEEPVVSSVEGSSFTFEFRRGCKRAKKAMPPPAEPHGSEESWREGISHKPNVVPAKTPAAKQAPKEVEFTHCAPGIVARLMGLDTVPRSKKVLDRCQSEIQSTMRQKLSGGVQEVARASCEDRPCRSSADELPELKDVFEVTEMENMVMRKAWQPENDRPRARSNEADLEFVRQKFLDAKRLSTDEGHRNSKEFGEALEVLYSKKDVFLEILQENSTVLSGFPGHILGYNGLQCSPHTSNSAGAQSFEQGNLRSTEVECESGDQLSLHLKETSVMPLEHLAPKGSKSLGRHSQIVVLKPNVQSQKLTPVTSTQEKSQFGQWTVTQPLKPPHRSMYKQDVTHGAAPNNIQVLDPERDMPELKVIKQTHKRASRRKPSGEKCYLAVGHEREKVASTSHDETLPISSSTRSAGSSVSRKARKHLSERWQMACQHNAEISLPTDTRTLGEMLELSDRDATKVITHKISSAPDVSHDNVHVVPASPLGISSKDGWKTGIYCEEDSSGGLSRNFPRSKSLPASSTTGVKLPGKRNSSPSPNLPILKDILNTPTDESGNGHVRKRSPMRKAKQKKRRVLFQVGKENMLPEKEIHVTSENARHSICTSDLSRTRVIYNEHPGDVISAEDQKTVDSAVSHDDVQNFKCQIGWTEEKLATSLPETKEDITIHSHNNIALKEGKSQSLVSDIAEVDHRAVKYAHIVSSESNECSSPTASLQQSSGEETAYSGIFKSVNDGILELRAQLKMLKMDDQIDTCRDDFDTFSSDERNDADISGYQVKEEQLPRFKDEEDRDYTYVQDMVGPGCDSSIYPEEWQVSSDVFPWLENKYSKLLLWSRSDRKLLFDLVNSILADMTAPGSSSLRSKIMMNCWPEMDWRKLAENVWQTVLLVRRSYQQFDLDSVQPLPLDHDSELEVFGTEIVQMIHDDVLEEFVAELISQGG